MSNSGIVRGVRAVFDAIANDFDSKRSKPFPSIERICARISLGSIVLDGGTGNGRHIPSILREGGRAVAVDISLKMLRLCKQNLRIKGLHPRVEPVLCDISELPFKEDAFTGILYSAVLHHLPHRLRRKALRELSRTLRPKGVAIITLWSNRALKVRFDAREVWGFSSKGDYFIPWKTSDEEYERYYHLFSAEEARRELAESSIAPISIFEEGLNIIIVWEK
ncbi:MAG: methyltransferase domain-containing protein [Thermoproteota archaeon]